MGVRNIVAPGRSEASSRGGRSAIHSLVRIFAVSCSSPNCRLIRRCRPGFVRLHVAAGTTPPHDVQAFSRTWLSSKLDMRNRGAWPFGTMWRFGLGRPHHCIRACAIGHSAITSSSPTACKRMASARPAVDEVRRGERAAAADRGLDLLVVADARALVFVLLATLAAARRTRTIFADLGRGQRLCSGGRDRLVG